MCRTYLRANQFQRENANEMHTNTAHAPQAAGWVRAPSLQNQSHTNFWRSVPKNREYTSVRNKINDDAEESFRFQKR